MGFNGKNTNEQKQKMFLAQDTQGEKHDRSKIL